MRPLAALMIGVGYDEAPGIWTGGDSDGSGGRSLCQESGVLAEDTATEGGRQWRALFFYDFLCIYIGQPGLAHL